MKVIQPGSGQRGWSKECTCTGKGNGGGGCGAKLLVEQVDLYRTAHHCYDGSSDYFETFMCVECGVETDVEGMPSNIATSLLSKREWIKQKMQMDSALNGIVS